jgi:hypothetical protein
MSHQAQTQPSPADERRLRDVAAIEESDDDALILWMLSLTPTQRLEAAQGFVESVQVLRNGRRA